MPRHCVVPQCKSNYKSSVKSDGAKTTFSFPRDVGLKAKWCRAIPRKDWIPSKHAAVCELHFDPGEIVTFDKHVLPDGTFKMIPYKPKLKEYAVPSIFPNLPKYLSTKKLTVRQDPEFRRQNKIQQQEILIQNFEKSDMIENYEEFISVFSEKLNFSDSWNIKILISKVVFYTLNVDADVISVENDILINTDLTVKIFAKGNELHFNELKWILNFDMKINRWSQVQNLLDRFKFTYYYDGSQKDSLPKLLQHALISLKKALELTETDDAFKYSKQLEIIVDQVSQMTRSKKKYSTSTVIAAFMIYIQSPATYNLLQFFLILPTKRYSQYLSSAMDVSPNKEKNNKHYLTKMSSTLSDTDKIVVLLIDEIYINSRLDYRAKSIIGTASNKEQVEVAKTILSFMICSAFGNFCEIVKLIPVLNITGNEMVPVTQNVITMVQNCGFQILCVITDNHRINRTMFNSLPSSCPLPSTSKTETAESCNFIPNPSDSNNKIFLTIDFVHLFKNIRGNWLNLKNLDNTFICPDFNTFEIKYAKFKDIREIYFKEKDLVVKKAYKLTYRTVYPSNLERQKVFLVDNVFHHSTIASLRDFNHNDTADFLKIIKNWWDIVHNTSVLIGEIKRNEWSKPIYSVNDSRIDFLKKVCTKYPYISLTKQRFNLD